MTDPEQSNPMLLEVEDLEVRFPGSDAPVVDGVSFSLAAGRTLGLVGSSGCGKTTLARAILRLIPARRGRIGFDGTSILDLSPKALKSFRRRMQIVFQDPGGSLNGRMRVGEIVGEPLLVHEKIRGRVLQERVESLLQRCGIDPDTASRYPHEFSGGQKQRIAIARAIALTPALVVCDEPTSALDVSVQARILHLLETLQTEYGIAFLFITHDMAVVRHICHEVAVMDSGRIVESGPVDRVLEHPEHQITRQLLDAVPRSCGIR
ncbi:MAG: peptide ABC transporter substrate-binding protein [Phycisphaerae bacterium]|jgi:ABC-type microcin C transport system duplicated ATPase subunit YejF|nr:peptide ABC transporter substrate-binding protein [Phycisphaerae bacterium]|tara:strand:- start:1309 stop:2100 length:792 start_codon:yes stop_codon:yes gene_type:complete